MKRLLKNALIWIGAVMLLFVNVLPAYADVQNFSGDNMELVHVSEEKLDDGNVLVTEVYEENNDGIQMYATNRTKDIDEVTSFLRLWQKEIQKRLTKKDYMSAEKSRKLRQRKYQEVRDQHIVVHGGEFAGKLLADLLEKDLMGIPLEDSEKKEERLSLMVA